MQRKSTSDPKPGAAQPSVPFRTVVLSMVVLWGTYFLLITARSYIKGMELHGEMILPRTVVTVAGIGLTMVLWAWLRLVERQALWIKIGAAIIFAIPVAIATGQINQIVFSDIQNKMKEIERKDAEDRGFRYDEEGNLLYDLPAGVAIKAPSPDGSGAIKVSESLIIAQAPSR